MRIALLAALAAAGCGRPLPPAPLVELPRASAEAPPPSASPTAVATAAPPPPPPASTGPCSPGAPVDPAKVYEPLAGSFSGPGLDEMIGAVECDPEGHDPGGHALVRRTGDAWAVVRVIPRPNPRSSLGRCKKLRLSTGRDLPICHLGSVSYGELYDSVVTLDYTRPETEEVSSLVDVADTTDTACTGQTELVIGSIVDVALLDVDHDGNLDVRVTVRAAKVHVPPQPPCQGMGFLGAGQPPPNLPRPPVQTIDFIARGAALTPTPAGARALKAIAAMRTP